MFPKAKWIVLKLCWNLQHEVVTANMHIKSSIKVLIFVGSYLLKIWLSSFSRLFLAVISGITKSAQLA